MVSDNLPPSWLGHWRNLGLLGNNWLLISLTFQFVDRLLEKLVYLSLDIFDYILEVIDLLLLCLHFQAALLDELSVDFVVWILELQLLLVHVVARDQVVAILV
jgi:hypothetical protein